MTGAHWDLVVVRPAEATVFVIRHRAEPAFHFCEESSAPSGVHLICVRGKIDSHGRPQLWFIPPRASPPSCCDWTLYFGFSQFSGPRNFQIKSNAKRRIPIN